MASLTIVVGADVPDVPAALAALSKAMAAGDVVLGDGVYALVRDQRLAPDAGEDADAFELRVRRVVTDAGAGFSLMIGMN